MSIPGIIVSVCLIIFALWIVRDFLPSPYKTPALILVVVLALVWVFSLIFPGLDKALL